MMFFRQFARNTPPPAIEPVLVAFPVLHGGEIAATAAGEPQGGDFYDSLRVNPVRVLFGLLDVAGHRRDNQQILARAQQVFREAGTELLSPAEVNEADAMAGLCLRLNRALMETGSTVHPCPAFAGCYNEDLGTVCYVNAGHTPGLVRDNSGVAELAATGLPLGLFSHVTYDSPTVALEPGGVLLLVSRGVVEATCEGQEYGIERVKDMLRRDTREAAPAICATVIEAAQTFSCHQPDRNDLTALALVRSGR
ncbi:MAG TPA: SpoIIE family protein phosphatase [Terriglobales bacterium]|nr:SpoIIE family protein phosphatase [Terriglobales bacterium]